MPSPMLDLFPMDCLAWVLVAFFLGYNGQAGTEYLRKTIIGAEKVEEEVTNDSSGKDSEDTDETVDAPSLPPAQVPRDSTRTNRNEKTSRE